MDLGMNEILLVLVVALLVYGDRLPQVARSLGRTVATLKRTISESSAAVTREIEATTAVPDDDEDTERPRTVRRIPQPVPDDLAKEDISLPATPPGAPEDHPEADEAARGAADGTTGGAAAG